jgi:hypothetical protein
MVGVAEQDLRADLLQFPRVERLHARLRAHRHIGRGLHQPMSRGQPAQTGGRSRVGAQQFEHERAIQP